jgi:peptide/nickel transport system permease protein
MRYALRKVGLLLLTVWAAVTVNFILPRLMPGSPADAVLAKLAHNGPVNPATKAAIEAQLGVPTGNLGSQYLDYLNSLLHFNFGLSYTFFPESVGSLVLAALPWTIVLVGVVTIVAFIVGTLLGVLAAWKRGTWFETLPTVAGTFASAFPYFWTALLCCSSSATSRARSRPPAHTVRLRRPSSHSRFLGMPSATASCLR